MASKTWSEAYARAIPVYLGFDTKDRPLPRPPSYFYKDLHLNVFDKLNIRDCSYPAVRYRQQTLTNCEKCCYNKVSLVLEGEDREGGFIYALRRLYKTTDFPDLDCCEETENGKHVHFWKQLIGLPRYGARTHLRDKDTHELITATEAEQPPRRRICTGQIIFNEIHSLSDTEGPLQLCEALRDAMYGLLNAYRMGYVHRRITEKNIYSVKCRCEHMYGCMLAKDGKSVDGLPRLFSGFVSDFTVCQNLNGDKDQYTGDTEIFDQSCTTPSSLLRSKKLERSDYVHSPIYDLDSFLWVLIVVSTGVINDYIFGRRKVKLDCPEIAQARISRGTKRNTNASGEGPIGVDDMNPKETRDEAVITPKAVMPDVAGAASEGIAPMETDAEEMNRSRTNQCVDEDERMDIEPVKIESGRGAYHENTDQDDGTITHPDSEERMEQERRDEEHEKSNRAKGKGKATQEETSEDKELPADDVLRIPEELQDFLWYYDDSYQSSLGIGFHVMKPVEHVPPQDFKPPEKPKYVAFAEDKFAYIINTLSGPRTMPDRNRIARLHLAYRLNELVVHSPGLAPFCSLIMELNALGGHYFVRDPTRETKFSNDEVEEAFAHYLNVFQKFMPKQDNWLYLKWYEGSDILYKFDQEKFLGAFASPTILP